MKVSTVVTFTDGEIRNLIQEKAKEGAGKLPAGCSSTVKLDTDSEGKITGTVTFMN